MTRRYPKLIDSLVEDFIRERSSTEEQVRQIEREADDLDPYSAPERAIRDTIDTFNRLNGISPL